MFYFFYQNNSGGYYKQTSDIDEIVVIEADTPELANNKADELGMFDLAFCPCCGERFDCVEEQDGYTLKQIVKDNIPIYQNHHILVHFSDNSKKLFRNTEELLEWANYTNL